LEDCSKYQDCSRDFKLFQAFKFPAVVGTAPYHLAFVEQQTQNDSTDDSTQSIDDAKPYVTASLDLAIKNGTISVRKLNIK